KRSLWLASRYTRYPKIAQGAHSEMLLTNSNLGKATPTLFTSSFWYILTSLQICVYLFLFFLIYLNYYTQTHQSKTEPTFYFFVCVLYLLFVIILPNKNYIM